MTCQHFKVRKFHIKILISDFSLKTKIKQATLQNGPFYVNRNKEIIPFRQGVSPGSYYTNWYICLVPSVAIEFAFWTTDHTSKYDN